ncbi:cache domain-containing sensor histidine kinase [Gorillibacterium massiliense]|uniref:cache domain-containing sensor histidine kinase n=1 Tax=Gorillibacterium massiliense TaxID=1280390 RepID=UPI0004BCE1A6|nr:sensor histidine kinase [Gorillibacterium massiliense]
MRLTKNRSDFAHALPMEWKLILIFVILIMIPIPLFGYLSNSIYEKSIRAKSLSYLTQVVQDMSAKFDMYTEDMKRISRNPAYVDAIKDNLELSNELYDKLEKEQDKGTNTSDGSASLFVTQAIESSISFLNNIKQETQSIYLFDRHGNPYYSYKNGFRRDIVLQYPEWKQALQDQEGSPLLLRTMEIETNANIRNYVFSVIRELFNDSYQSIGMIVVDSNISYLEKVAGDVLKASGGGRAMIIDQSRYVIYDSNKEYLTKQLPNDSWLSKMVGDQGDYIADYYGEKSMIVYNRSTITNWTVVVTVPLTELTRDVQTSRVQNLVASLFLTGLAMCLSVIVAFAITRSLRTLIRLMKNVQMGDLDVEFPVTYRDEVGRLGRQFNRMIERIRMLIQENFEIGERKKQAEINALQSQINPHFLYNTLETIRMTAEINDDEEVADMTRLLGKMLRYSISKGSDLVKFEQELEHLKHYILLQQYRYPGKLRIEYDIPEDMESVRVLKLILQPIVENAIFHGMESSRSFLLIKVSVEVSEQELKIRIQDNGKGMELSELKQLRKRLEQPGTDKRGIGLGNVNERLKMHYGVQYGLEIDSEAGLGTEVKIKMPIHIDGGDSNASNLDSGR